MGTKHKPPYDIKRIYKSLNVETNSKEYRLPRNVFVRKV